MSITGKYIHRFQYVEYTNKNIPSSIADCLIKKLLMLSQSMLPILEIQPRNFLNIPIL